jgi:hypothetical protein
MSGLVTLIHHIRGEGGSASLYYAIVIAQLQYQMTHHFHLSAARMATFHEAADTRKLNLFIASNNSAS